MLNFPRVFRHTEEMNNGDLEYVEGWFNGWQQHVKRDVLPICCDNNRPVDGVVNLKNKCR